MMKKMLIAAFMTLFGFVGAANAAPVDSSHHMTGNGKGNQEWVVMHFNGPNAEFRIDPVGNGANKSLTYVVAFSDDGCGYFGIACMPSDKQVNTVYKGNYTSPRFPLFWEHKSIGIDWKDGLTISETFPKFSEVFAFFKVIQGNVWVTPNHDYDQPAPVPLPAGGFLLLSALGGGYFMSRKKKANV